MRRFWIGAILLWPLLVSTSILQAQQWPYKVFDNLVQAYGRIHPSAPTLVITPIAGVVAEAKDDGRIFIGEDFVELCTTLGKDSANAMAMVLAHELAHHYHHHFWAATYGSAFADSDWGKKIDSLGNAVAFRSYYESQADDFGLFFSYLAGYETFTIAEKVYNAIYSHFQLPDELPGYPSKEERIAIAEMASARVKELIPIFETGKYLYILSISESGAYQQQLLHKAEQCYTTLLDRNLASREIFNALGVIYLQSGLSYLDPKQHPFHYPIILDEESRLYGEGAIASAESTSGFGTNEAMAKTMLDKALYYLDEATDLDQHYGIAYLNRAIAYLLLQRPVDAQYYIGKAEEVALAKENDRLLAFCWEVKGMLNAADKTDALASFGKAKELGSPTANANADRLQGKVAPSSMPSFGGFGQQQMETADGKELPSLYDEIRYQLSARDRFTVGPNSYIFQQPYKQGQVFIAECNERDCPYDNLVFYETPLQPQQQSAKGITGGDQVEKVLDKYGNPSQIISTGTYEYYQYKDQKILFQIGSDNRVHRWILYYFI